MQMNKQAKGIAPIIWVGVVIVAVLLFTVGPFQDVFKGGTIGGSDEVQSCGDATSVTYTYNDIDDLEPSTDPASAVQLTTKNGALSVSNVNDDGTLTATPLATYSGLYAHNSTTYFSRPADFKTGCVNNDMPDARVINADAGTVTGVNDDGRTTNSASAQQSVGADTTTTVYLDIAPSTRNCVYKYGGVLIVDYDDTYWSSFSAGAGLVDVTESVKGSLHYNTSYDSFKTFKFDTETLCGSDGTKTVSFDATSSSTDPTDSLGDMFITIAGKDYYINGDSLKVEGPALYDEDGNIEYHGNSTEQYFVS